MKATGIIPARFDSSRFEGKVLAEIQGKPLIWHVYTRAKQAKLLDEVIIATDSKKVKKTAEKFGAEVVMTDSNVATGTDRISQVAESIHSDLVVNIQGDEPLINPPLIDELIQKLYDDLSLNITTAVYKTDTAEELNDPNVVKVVKSRDDFALYFSRSLIPYPRNKEKLFFYKHLGIYAYRRGFLLSFSTLPPADLEEIEGLEQLRVLEYGYKIKVIESKVDSVGVDTPEDLEKVRKIMEKESA
jgi:3-deoxy-manno-octulosonate cytidylyltransferase (CMP-KDO synthetase)